MSNCPYCGKEFDSEAEERQHRRKSFFGTDPIPKSTKNRNKDHDKRNDWSNSSSVASDGKNLSIGVNCVK